MFSKRNYNILRVIGILFCAAAISGCGATRSSTRDSGGAFTTNPPSIAGIQHNPITTIVLSTPFTVTLSAQISDAGENPIYLWEFGDGTTSDAKTPSHTYTYQGHFYYALTVYNSKGQDRMIVQIPIQIIAGNNQPQISTLNITPPTANPGVPINFSCTASDPDIGDTLTYSWNFGDGNSSELASPTHTYGLNDLYEVRLTVTDQHGSAKTKTRYLGVGTSAPPYIDSITFTPVTGRAPISIDFDCQAGDLDGTISTYNWDFGDGNTATGKTVSHLYNQGGTFTIKLRITDNDGLITTKEEKLTLTDTGSE